MAKESERVVLKGDLVPRVGCTLVAPSLNRPLLVEPFHTIRKGPATGSQGEEEGGRGGWERE